MSARNLRYMQKFASEFDNDEFLQGVLAKLSWNHNQTLLDKVKDKEIENEDYYIDLLFYNLKVRSYVVIELKTTEFKPEYTGKLNFYLSAVDKYIKDESDNPTFGILLCKDKKRVTAELALKEYSTKY